MRHWWVVRLWQAEQLYLVSRDGDVWYWCNSKTRIEDEGNLEPVSDYGPVGDESYEDAYARFLQDYPPRSGIEDSFGWLSPEGTYYPCGYCMHGDLASDLIIWRYPDEDPYDDDVLIERGWRRVTDSAVYPWPDVAYTQAQLDTLFDLSLVASGDVLRGVTLWLRRAQRYTVK